MISHRCIVCVDVAWCLVVGENFAGFFEGGDDLGGALGGMEDDEDLEALLKSELGAADDFLATEGAYGAVCLSACCMASRCGAHRGQGVDGGAAPFGVGWEPHRPP